MRRILLTGATGFIGSPILRMLAADGDEVHAVSSRAVSSARDGNIFYHQGDLLNRDERQTLVEQIQATHLLHLAWEVDYDSPLNFDWVQASFELVREFQKQGGERAVLAGTCYEYDAESGYYTEGKTPLRPHTTYAECKDVLRRWVTAYAATVNLRFAWARIFFTYGPGESPGRLVPSVIQSLLNAQPAPCSHGEQVRDYLHVYDVASACIALLRSDMQGAVNVASGHPVRIKDLIEIIARELNQSDLVRLGAIEAGPSEPAFLVANTQKLRDELGWTPSFTLEAGLKHTINWWKREIQDKQKQV